MEFLLLWNNSIDIAANIQSSDRAECPLMDKNAKVCGSKEVP